jgi:hypothetical protein
MRRRPWKESEYESMWTSLDCESDVSTPLPERSVSSLSLAMVRSSWLPAADTFVRGVPALDETGVPALDALAAFSACLFNLDALMGAMTGDMEESRARSKISRSPCEMAHGLVSQDQLSGVVDAMVRLLQCRYSDTRRWNHAFAAFHASFRPENTPPAIILCSTVVFPTLSCRAIEDIVSVDEGRERWDSRDSLCRDGLSQSPSRSAP